MKPLVSIIVPVYNVEKYLDKCVASVVNQTYTNLEIILVDDGSPDNCPAICDAWKERDPRIKVIHQQNGGLSVARNEGLKLANGEFIGFIDSDDWIEPQMVETLLAALQETNADIAVCNYQIETEESKATSIKPESPDRKQYTPEEALTKIFKWQGFICNFVWNKLYRRTIISDIFFPAGKLHEDVPWTAAVIGNSKTIVSIDCPLYHYLNRPDSLTRDCQYKLRRLQDEREMIEQRLEYIRVHFPKLEKLAASTLQNFCCREYLEFSLNYSRLDTDGEIRRGLHRIACQYPSVIVLDRGNIGKTVARLLFRFCPNLLSKSYLLFNKLKSTRTASFNS